MVLQVAPAGEADAPRAITIENLAYGPSPNSRVLFPGPFPEGDTFRLNALVEGRRKDPACQWMKVVDTELASGGGDGTIAFTQFFVWERESINHPREWGPGTNVEACEALFGGMKAKWWERFQGRPHLYLKLLHTDPAHQRRGAGGMLLTYITNEADRLGLEAYLEATPEGFPLYIKYGFEELDRHSVDFSKWGGDSEPESVLMLRKAKMSG
ncbi:hypothetical protein PT974_01942 [Cladobotryum mycophilum]|uniref:N-acetyltransferase domain-containing protein n=1 Tax=Cladobotryum mycophilum TaxID=491253 RepID=A0ABR0SXU2_9HYPO